MTGQWEAWTNREQTGRKTVCHAQGRFATPQGASSFREAELAAALPFTKEITAMEISMAPWRNRAACRTPPASR